MCGISRARFNYRVFYKDSFEYLLHWLWCHSSNKLWVILFTIKHIQYLTLCIVYPLQERKCTFCYCIHSFFSDDLHSSCGLPWILHPARRNIRWFFTQRILQNGTQHKLNYLAHCNFVIEAHWNSVICYGRSIMDYNPLHFNNMD